MKRRKSHKRSSRMIPEQLVLFPEYDKQTYITNIKRTIESSIETYLVERGKRSRISNDRPVLPTIKHLIKQTNGKV